MIPVFVLSVQHTGTWFTIDMLRWNPAITQFIELHNVLYANEAIERDGRPLIHVHLCDEHAEHPEKFKHVTTPVAEAISTVAPVIIPLRDPLLAMITRHVRQPDLDHSYIVRAFSAMAESSVLTKRCCFLPIDAREDETARRLRLRNVHEFLGLPWHDGLDEIATQWKAPAYNVTPDHELKQAYHAGDLLAIRRAMPVEFDLLRDNARLIGEFLRSKGYRTAFAWE